MVNDLIAHRNDSASLTVRLCVTSMLPRISNSLTCTTTAPPDLSEARASLRQSWQGHRPDLWSKAAHLAFVVRYTHVIRGTTVLSPSLYQTLRIVYRVVADGVRHSLPERVFGISSARGDGVYELRDLIVLIR